MKKLLSIICVAGLMALSVQQADAQDTKFGIKGGGTLYSVTTSFAGFEETSSNKIGFAAGLFVEKPFNDLVSLQVEGLFVQKGGEEEGDEFFGDEDITLSYVDVPVLLRVNIPLDGGAQPYVYAGGFAGYLLDATASEEGFEDEDVSEFLEDFNYGLTFGAGVSFGMLSLDVRYDMGLANIYDDSMFADMNDGFGDFFGDAGIEGSTSGFMLTAGISF